MQVVLPGRHKNKYKFFLRYWLFIQVQIFCIYYNKYELLLSTTIRSLLGSNFTRFQVLRTSIGLKCLPFKKIQVLIIRLKSNKTLGFSLFVQLLDKFYRNIRMLWSKIFPADPLLK